LDDEDLYFGDPIKIYLSELHKIPSLGCDEEIECMQHVRAGDRMAESAGKRLAEANLLLVVSIAERYQNDRIHLLDLIQKGNEGLLRAVRTLTDSPHDSFAAHAAGEIEDAIAEFIAATGSSGA
jgi:RNA polymerase primary sigma factor